MWKGHPEKRKLPSPGVRVASRGGRKERGSKRGVNEEKKRERPGGRANGVKNSSANSGGEDKENHRAQDNQVGHKKSESREPVNPPEFSLGGGGTHGVFKKNGQVDNK